jgi:hypothetical protein
MSVRDKNSKQAQIQREYRARKKANLIKDIMEKEKVSEEKAREIATNRIRKKNSETRQKLRMKKRGSKIVKEEKEEKEEKSNLVKVSPFTTEEIKKIKGDLQVQKNIKTDDDNKAFNKLSYVEQKLVNRMNKVNKSSVRSIVQYLNKVKQVYKKAGKTFDGTNIGFLKNKKELLETLSLYKNPKDHLYGIIIVLKTFFNTESLVEYYEKIMKKLIDKNTREIRKNEKTKKQDENWINYDKLIKLYKQNKNKLNDNDKLLMSFIIFFPRRLQDYYKMKLHKTGKKDMNYNYLNMNKFGMPSSFQFFRSKSQNYEDTTKRIPSSLKNIIMTYIKKKGVKNNQLLFPKSEGEIHTADSFSKHIRKLFKVITDKDINMNLWRHIVATNTTDKNYNMNKREEIAQNMGHNLLRSYEYSKK